MNEPSIQAQDPESTMRATDLSQTDFLIPNRESVLYPSPSVFAKSKFQNTLAKSDIQLSSGTSESISESLSSSSGNKSKEQRPSARLGSSDKKIPGMGDRSKAAGSRDSTMRVSAQAKRIPALWGTQGLAASTANAGGNANGQSSVLNSTRQGVSGPQMSMVDVANDEKRVMRTKTLHAPDVRNSGEVAGGEISFRNSRESPIAHRQSSISRPIFLHLNSKYRVEKEKSPNEIPSPKKDDPPTVRNLGRPSLFQNIKSYFKRNKDSSSSGEKPRESDVSGVSGISSLTAQNKKRPSEAGAAKQKQKKSTVATRRSMTEAAGMKRDVSALFEDKNILALDIKKKGPQPKDPLNEKKRPKSRSRCLVRYNSQWKKRWDGFIALAAYVNGFFVPLNIAFFQDPAWVVSYGFEFLFAIDLLLQFRVSIFSKSTGDEITATRKIACLYLCSVTMLFDLLPSIPFSLFMKGEARRLLQGVQLLKLLSLWKLDFNFNQSEIMKLVFKLIAIILSLLIYVNFTTCLLFYIAALDKQWVPIQIKLSNPEDVDFYGMPMRTKYVSTLYTSILILSGNQIEPVGDLQTTVAGFLTILGSLIIANIFGTIAVVVAALNRKNHKFQEKIDTANSSMFNMKIPQELQDEVRQFMVSTQNNLDTQKELDQFMQMVSPSLRNKVTKYIFMDAIVANSVFQQGSQDLIDFIINDVTTLLFLPEDTIIKQGQKGESLFLIAKGECGVWVKDHMRQTVFIRQLCQGDYFGEISILTDSVRTASVKSQNYCTMACIRKRVFYDLCNNFPDILIQMKKKALEYNDPWKEFKMTVLRQVDYFREMIDTEEFYNELQFLMEEEFLDKGTDILLVGEASKALIFIVQGQVSIIAIDDMGNECEIEVLEQGDLIGQYSVLFDEESNFTARATTNVRILTLTQEFFIQNQDAIEGIEEAIEYAEDLTTVYGMPICDYKRFSSGMSIKEKIRRVIHRLHRLKQSNCDAYEQLLEQKKQPSQMFDHEMLRKLNQNRSANRLLSPQKSFVIQEQPSFKFKSAMFSPERAQAIQQLFEPNSCMNEKSSSSQSEQSASSGSSASLQEGDSQHSEQFNRQDSSTPAQDRKHVNQMIKTEEIKFSEQSEHYNEDCSPIHIKSDLSEGPALSRIDKVHKELSLNENNFASNPGTPSFSTFQKPRNSARSKKSSVSHKSRISRKSKSSKSKKTTTQRSQVSAPLDYISSAENQMMQIPQVTSDLTETMRVIENKIIDQGPPKLITSQSLQFIANDNSRVESELQSPYSPMPIPLIEPSWQPPEDQEAPDMPESTSNSSSSLSQFPRTVRKVSSLLMVESHTAAMLLKTQSAKKKKSSPAVDGPAEKAVEMMQVPMFGGGKQSSRGSSSYQPKQPSPGSSLFKLPIKQSSPGSSQFQSLAEKVPRVPSADSHSIRRGSIRSPGLFGRQVGAQAAQGGAQVSPPSNNNRDAFEYGEAERVRKAVIRNANKRAQVAAGRPSWFQKQTTSVVREKAEQNKKQTTIPNRRASKKRFFTRLKQNQFQHEETLMDDSGSSVSSVSVASFAKGDGQRNNGLQQKRFRGSGV